MQFGKNKISKINNNIKKPKGSRLHTPLRTKKKKNPQTKLSRLISRVFCTWVLWLRHFFSFAPFSAANLFFHVGAKRREPQIIDDYNSLWDSDRSTTWAPRLTPYHGWNCHVWFSQQQQHIATSAEYANFLIPIFGLHLEKGVERVGTRTTWVEIRERNYSSHDSRRRHYWGRERIITRTKTSFFHGWLIINIIFFICFFIE